jgi:hypothetical protein
MTEENGIYSGSVAATTPCVAWMERSGIRESTPRLTVFPALRCAACGLRVLSVHGTHPTKTASHVGWVKPRKRRTQQNITIRQVSLWLTYDAFELLADVGCVPRTNYYSLVRGTHPTKNEPGYC